MSNNFVFQPKHIKYASFDQPNVSGFAYSYIFPLEKCKNITKHKQQQNSAVKTKWYNF